MDKSIDLRDPTEAQPDAQGDSRLIPVVHNEKIETPSPKDPALAVFRLRMQFAKVAFWLAVGLTTIGAAVAIVTGDYRFAACGLGAGVFQTCAHMHLNAAQKIARPSSGGP